MSAPEKPYPSHQDRGFAHASEAEFARILDFYEVRWEYEPQVFPILWDLAGSVLESFAPDFYLPDIDLFVEMTTLQQRLVRKKNRKVRRLRELYPGIRIKLFYARDFRALMLKYGRSALVAELSGTVGQVGPRQEAEATLEASPDATIETSPVNGERRSRTARRRAGRKAAAHAAESPTS
jgi:hypothetical protein